MKINELETILKYADVDKQQPVRIKVKTASKTYTVAEIKCFDTFSDGILLTVETDFDVK